MPYDKNQIFPEYIIYKLCCDDTDLFYVGSTRDFTSRKNRHKNTSKNPNIREYNTKKYQTMREFGGFENWRMVPIEILNDVTKLQAEMREEEMRVEIKALLNSQKASCGGITKQEYDRLYREEHKEQIKENDKQYYKKNRDKYIERTKQYYEENKEKVNEKHKKYAQDNKEHIKEYMKDYYQEKKEQFKEHNKQYREEHKEQIQLQKKQKIDCECGGKYTHCHKARHLRTQLHQKYLLIKTI